MKANRKYRLIYRRSLYKMLGLSFALLLVALLAIASYYVFGILRQSRAAQQQNFLQFSTHAQEQLEISLSDSQQIAHNVAYSTPCQKYLLSSHPSTVIESMRDSLSVLSYTTLSGGKFKDVVILSNTGLYGRYLANTTAYTSMVRKTLGQYGLSENLQFTQPFYSDLISDANGEYLLYFFPVYGNIDGFRYRYNMIVGTIVYDMDNLLQQLNLTAYPHSISLILKEGAVLAGTKTLTEAEAASLSEISPGQSTCVIDGNTYLLRRSKLENSDLEVLFLLPNQGNYNLFTRENQPILIFAFLLLLIILLMNWIIRHVNKDIFHMTQSIQLAETTARTIPEPYFNELLPISQAMNQTFASLDEASQREQQLISDSYEALLAQSRAEQLAYRSQINPHFLFNTLESVRSLAHHHGVQPIEKLIGGMSQMFRYSLYAPMIVPLQTELEHLKSYLAVMNIRFPGRYDVRWDTSSETLTLPVQSMILQPLVENTTKHAFQGRLHGIVLVRSFLRQNHLVIQIVDNGIGMSEERQHELMERIRSGAEEHPTTASNALSSLIDRSSEDISIGLTNIYRRLRLSFGKEADLTVRSKEEYYTVVELTIPVPTTASDT